MATINGKTVPFTGDLAPGKFWTSSYTHSVRGEASQCLGFAYLIYNKIWGSDTYGKTIAYKKLAGTADDFSGIKPGAWVRGGDMWHVVVITAISDKDVTIYDCNRAGTLGNCEIGTKTYTFSAFKTAYTSFEYGYTPE